MRVGLLRIGNARNDGKNKVAHAVRREAMTDFRKFDISLLKF